MLKFKQFVREVYDYKPTPEEDRSIKHYSGEEFYDVNRNLYSGKSHKDPKHQEIDNHLSAAIKKNKFGKDTVLHTGMRSPEDIPSQNGKKVVHNRAYTSTSLDASEAKHFGGINKHGGGKTDHVYHDQTKERYDPQKHSGFKETDKKTINARTFQHKSFFGGVDKSKGKFEGYRHVSSIHVPAGSHGLHIAKHSIHDKIENEVLLHKGAKIAYDEKPHVDHENKRVVWKGKLIHDGIKPTRHAQDN